MSIAEKEDLLLLEGYYRSEAEDMISFAAYLLNNNESMAEVAVQETFLIALKKIQTLKSSPNPVGWLYITLKNIIKHIHRDQQRQLSRIVSIDALQAVPAAEKNLDLWLLLESCDHADARILIDFYLKNRTIKELAGEYGITIGACKMRIKRAKERARTQ